MMPDTFADRRYVGIRSRDGTRVAVEYPGRRGHLLIHVARHSQGGFDWGNRGNRAADLALSILLDALCDRELAERLYRRFAAEVIATLDRDGFSLPRANVLEWAARVDPEDAEAIRTDRCRQVPVD